MKRKSANSAAFCQVKALSQMQFLSLDWPGKSTLWAFCFEMASRRFESRQTLKRIHCCLLSGWKTSGRLVGRLLVVVDGSDRLPKAFNSRFQPNQFRSSKCLGGAFVRVFKSTKWMKPAFAATDFCFIVFTISMHLFLLAKKPIFFMAGGLVDPIRSGLVRKFEIVPK